MTIARNHQKWVIRLLLVEDNYTNRQLLSDYLSFCGYTVLGLEDGLNFAEAMSTFQPHLVLLDLKLPGGVDGYTLLQYMQQNPAWKRIPAIVVSAYAFQADQQHALQLGARRYFVKPVKLAQLKQAICEELDYLLLENEQ
jgi:two-component system cell cycle response regulator DivK